MGRWVYGGGGDQGGTYWQPDYEGDEPPELGLTKEQVTSVFQNVLGRDPNEYDLQSWVGWGDVDGSFDEEKALWDVAYDITTLPEYQQKTQPFYDPNKRGKEYFGEGVRYYTDKGYIPSGNYLGNPNAFYDKEGNLVAWYGNLGRTFGKSGKYTPNRSEDYGWHMADELKNVPNAIPSAARSTSDTQGWLGGGQWIAPVAMMGTLLGAAALAPLAAGAAGAAGAGEAGALAGTLGAAEAGAGSLTAGITPSMVAGWEAALPTAFGEIGAGSLTAGITPSMVAGWEAALPSAFGEVGAGSLTAGITPEMVAGWESALPSNLAEMGLGSSGLSSVKDVVDVVRKANTVRNLIGKVSNIAGGGSSGSSSGASGAGGSSPLNVLAVNAPQVAQAYPVTPPITPFMTSMESPSEVAARGIKMEGVQSNPQLANVTPQLRKLLIDRLGTNQNQFIADPLGALDRGELSPGFRRGGEVINEDGEPHIPEFITGKTGHYVQGDGDGQADLVPAMLASGEFVFDSSTVSTLGNGDSNSGAKLLDAFRQELREHTRSAPKDKIPPKVAPLKYMKAAMEKVGMK